jgi:hypothetical protein
VQLILLPSPRVILDIFLDPPQIRLTPNIFIRRHAFKPLINCRYGRPYGRTYVCALFCGRGIRIDTRYWADTQVDPYDIPRPISYGRTCVCALFFGFVMDDDHPMEMIGHDCIFTQSHHGEFV